MKYLMPSTILSTFFFAIICSSDCFAHKTYIMVSKYNLNDYKLPFTLIYNQNKSLFSVSIKIPAKEAGNLSNVYFHVRKRINKEDDSRQEIDVSANSDNGRVVTVEYEIDNNNFYYINFSLYREGYGGDFYDINLHTWHKTQYSLDKQQTILYLKNCIKLYESVVYEICNKPSHETTNSSDWLVIDLVALMPCSIERIQALIDHVKSIINIDNQVVQQKLVSYLKTKIIDDMMYAKSYYRSLRQNKDTSNILKREYGSYIHKINEWLAGNQDIEEIIVVFNKDEESHK